MSSAIGLLSSSAIEPNELATFIITSGGVVAPDAIGQGRISAEDRHIWIYFSPEELEGVMEVEGEAIVRTLGERPKTNIVIEISRTPGSEELAINFALKFAEKWPSVVSSVRGAVLSLEDLRKLQASGRASLLL